MGMTRVSNLKARAGLLGVGLLATLLVLALSACGGAGGQAEAKARPLHCMRTPCPPANTTRSSSNPHSPSRSASHGQTLKSSCPTGSNWGGRRRQGL